MTFAAMVFAVLVYPSLVRCVPEAPGPVGKCAFLALVPGNPQVGWWCCPEQTVSWEDGKVVGVRNYITDRCRAVLAQSTTQSAAAVITNSTDLPASVTSGSSIDSQNTRGPLITLISSVRARIVASCVLAAFVLSAVIVFVIRLCLVRHRRAPVDTALVGMNLLDVSSAPATLVTYL